MPEHIRRHDAVDLLSRSRRTRVLDCDRGRASSAPPCPARIVAQKDPGNGRADECCSRNSMTRQTRSCRGVPQLVALVAGSTLARHPRVETRIRPRAGMGGRLCCPWVRRVTRRIDEVEHCGGVSGRVACRWVTPGKFNDERGCAGQDVGSPTRRHCRDSGAGASSGARLVWRTPAPGWRCRPRGRRGRAAGGTRS
jgi:hypothetical protein